MYNEILGDPPRREGRDWPSRAREQIWFTDYITEFCGARAKTFFLPLPVAPASIGELAKSKKQDVYRTDTSSDRLVDAFWSVWFESNNLKPLLRLVISALFIIGFLGFVLILLQNFVSVLEYFERAPGFLYRLPSWLTGLP
jgi:hypothetical protein